VAECATCRTQHPRAVKIHKFRGQALDAHMYTYPQAYTGKENTQQSQEKAYKGMQGPIHTQNGECHGQRFADRHITIQKWKHTKGGQSPGVCTSTEIHHSLRDFQIGLATNAIHLGCHLYLPTGVDHFGQLPCIAESASCTHRRTVAKL
jgi:hypothetical protein